MKPSTCRVLAAACLLAAVGMYGVSPDTGRAQTASAGEPASKNPLPPNEKNIASGKALFARHCAECHGQEGRGDGKRAFDMDPPPTDLLSAEVSSESDAALFRKITRGRRPMPGFARQASDDERWQMVLYVRTLQEKVGGRRAG